MKSFELPVDKLRELEMRLKDRLDEVEHLQALFPAVLERLDGAADELRTSSLGRLVNLPFAEPGATTPALSYAEACSFAKRHSSEYHPQQGYRQMVDRIQKDHREMQLSNALLKDMHRHVVGFDTDEAGQWKNSDNYFPIYDENCAKISNSQTIGYELVPDYMNSLEERFLTAWTSPPVNSLLLIALYWLDFLSIHAFRDGNGRVSRLAVLLLLLQSGHAVTRHASLEGYVSRRRTAYITSLRASLDGWPAKGHDPFMWCSFFLDFLIDAYRDVSRRTDTLISTIEQTDSIITTLASMPGTFLTADLQARLPDVPDGLVRMALARLREDGTLRASVTEGVVIWERMPAEQKGQ